MFFQLFSDKFHIYRRDCLIHFVFGHPVNTHRIFGGCNSAIPPAVDRNKINHVVCFSVLGFALVERVADRMFPVWRDGDFKIRLKQTVAQNPQAFEHRATKHDGIY